MISPQRPETPVRSVRLRATVRPAGAETIAAQNRTSRLRLEWNRIGLAALIANDFKSFALCSSASLSGASEARAARVAAGFASLWMAQPTLAIIILFSFRKWE